MCAPNMRLFTLDSLSPASPATFFSRLTLWRRNKRVNNRTGVALATRILVVRAGQETELPTGEPGGRRGVYDSDDSRVLHSVAWFCLTYLPIHAHHYHLPMPACLHLHHHLLPPGLPLRYTPLGHAGSRARARIPAYVVIPLAWRVYSIRCNRLRVASLLYKPAAGLLHSGRARACVCLPAVCPITIHL